MRLTAGVRQQLLDVNEGFTRKTSFESKNSSDYRTYTISGGELHIRARGKGSWADSRYDNSWVATDEDVHRFLHKHYDELNWDGVVQTPAVRKPKLAAESPNAGSVSDVSADENEQMDPREALDKLKDWLSIGFVAVATVYLAGEWAWSRGIKPAVDKRRAARAERKADLVKQNEDGQAGASDEILGPED
ncbi:hypothetical protein AB0O65_08325 [Microbacterium sp. NPDC077391]|uniref:hypothetical protein n=1 Tax=unclassified Microbacterium TaxID=2609290 RepID=UPI0028B181E4|nr:hypothetical protein [Microbacterium sp.]